MRRSDRDHVCVLSRRESGDMGEVVQSSSAAWDAEHMNKPANAQHVAIKYVASLRAGTLAGEIRKQHTGLALSHCRTLALSPGLTASVVLRGRDPPRRRRGRGAPHACTRRRAGTECHPCVGYLPRFLL